MQASASFEAAHGPERIKYVAVGWAGLLGASVAGMAIVMQATSDPTATTANTIAFSTFAAVAFGIGWIVYRPLFRANGGTGATADSR